MKENTAQQLSSNIQNTITKTTTTAQKKKAHTQTFIVYYNYS